MTTLALASAGRSVFVCNQDFPLYQGFIKENSGSRGFSHILAKTVTHISGEVFKFSRSRDIFIHVRDNPKIAYGTQPELWIPGNMWVQFFLRKEPKRRLGVEAFGAKFVRI